MAKPIIKWSIKGFKELRRDPGVVNDLNERGMRVRDAAGPGYVMEGHQGRSRPSGRWRVTVRTGTPAAILDNAQNNTLIRALEAGR